VYYNLASVPDSGQPVKLEFLDATGRVLRSYERSATSAPTPPAGGSSAVVRTLPALKVGLNAFQWDLRADPPTTLPGNVTFFGGPGGGYLVSPGRYQVRLTAGPVVQTQPFEVREDPRLTVSPSAVASRDSLARTINARVGEIHDALLRIRDIKDQVAKFVDRAKEAPNAAAITSRGKAITTKIETLDPQLSTKAANGQDIINYRNGINSQYVFLLGNVEESDALSQPVRERFSELERLWSALEAQVRSIEREDVPAFNVLLQEGQVSGVIVPGKKPRIAM
jgi:hypothetical protein